MKLKSSLTKTCWQDIREEVHGIDSYLAGIIDEINPSNDLPLYIAEYPYGEIIDDGVFFYPDENGDLRPLSDSKLSRQVRDDFEYAGDATPAGMVIEKAIEVFTETKSATTPWGIYYPGDWFALNVRLNRANSKSFYPNRLINITSGVRSLYMLPNIGDAFLHKNLRGMLPKHLEAPKSLREQWSIFRELDKHNNLEERWKCKLLLLSSKWIQNLISNPDWSHLYVYLFQFGWNRFEFDRNRPFFDIAFSEIQESRNLKQNPYLVDIAKHIFKIIAHGAPGFAVSTSNISAPISFLQRVYSEVYGLKKYHPHIFTPANFTQGEEKALYYSLQVPTSLEFSPKTRKDSTTLSKMRDIKRIIYIFAEELLKVQTKLGNNAMSELLESLEIHFFHNKDDIEKEILSSKLLSEFDSSLVTGNGNEFAYSGTFLRGCILINANN